MNTLKTKMAKVKTTKENMEKCMCPSCPTHDIECMQKERLYCGKGKSKCKFEHQGCLCGGCPVHSENGLDEYYYCAKGAAK